MDAKKLGQEPANPVRGYTVDASGALCGETVTFYGLTKRELFAAMAMQGFNANPDPQVSSWCDQKTALCAVAFADALLAELAKEQS